MSDRPFYDADLAHIHDSGFVGYAHGCAPGVIGILGRAGIREYDARRERLTRQITTFRRAGEGYRKSDERHLLQIYPSRVVAAELRRVGFRVRTVRRFGSFPTLKRRIGFIARKP
jgi:hypothetical protein